MGAAVLPLGSSSSAFGDDVVLQLNGELQRQWWRSVERWRGGVQSSTQWLLSAAVVMWWAGWGVGDSAWREKRGARDRADLVI